MEEDMEVLKDFLELKEIHSSNDIRMSYLTIYQKAVKNLIARNKELEKENKIFKNKQTKIIADSFHKKMAKKFDEDFIPKSKVREKIEELEKERKKKDEEEAIDVFYDQIDITHIIEALQELLEED